MTRKSNNGDSSKWGLHLPGNRRPLPTMLGQELRIMSVMHQWISKWWLRREWNDMNISMHNWPNESIIESMKKWVGQSMNQWFSESMIQWIIASINESMIQWITEWVNYCVDESMNQWTNDAANQRMDMGRWINEPMHQRIDDSVNQWIVN